MTFNNAKRRLASLGCELARSHAYGRYKYRRIAGGQWRYGECLEALLVSAQAEHLGHKRTSQLTPVEQLLTALQG